MRTVCGSLHENESHADAARRELLEETGLSKEGELNYSGVSRTFEIDPRWRHRFPPGTVTNLEYEWRFRMRRACDIHVDTREHSAYRWAGIEEAIGKVWSWTNREALESLKEEL